MRNPSNSQAGDSMSATILLPNSSPLRAAFFDVDGTLVARDGTIGPVTCAEIAALSSAGVAVGLATGRPAFGAQRVVETLSISQPSMFFSGALVAAPQGNEALLEVGLEVPALQSLVRSLRAGRFYFELYTRADYFIESDHPHAAMHAGYLHRFPEITLFEPLILKEKILKVVVAMDSPDQERSLRTLLASHPDIHCAFSRGATHDDILFGNITSRFATRERAFEVLLRALRVEAAETIAFGDAEADLPFLRLAGHGVAMQNAPAAVCQEADSVCLTAEEDGVGHFLAQLRINQ